MRRPELVTFSPPPPPPTAKPRPARRPVGPLGHLAGAVHDFLIIAVAGLALAWLVAGAEDLTRRSIGVGAVLELSILSLLALYTLTDVAFRTSPGKSLFSLYIRDAIGAAAPLSRRLLRWTIKTSPLLLSIACSMLLAARSILYRRASAPDLLVAVIQILQVAALFALILVLAGTLLVFLPRRRPLHDLLAGTALFYEDDLTAAAADYRPGGFEVRPTPVAATAPEDPTAPARPHP